MNDLYQVATATDDELEIAKLQRELTQVKVQSHEIQHASYLRERELREQNRRLQEQLDELAAELVDRNDEVTALRAQRTAELERRMRLAPKAES